MFHQLTRTVIVFALLAVLLPTPGAQAASEAEIQAEISGIEAEATGPLPVRDPDAQQRAQEGIATTGLLLIPESSNDRVMAFDPMTGDLIDPDFIPADPTNLSTPIQAILSNDGMSILVSDQLEDVVQEYDLDGNYLGVFAPAGGADTSILDNIRGIALDASGNLLVTIGSGANADAVAQFDTAGMYLGNFVANGADGLDSPFDVLPRAADFLVGGITSDVIHAYDASGMPLPQFSPINTFPEQIAEGAASVLVANFSGTQEGVVEFSNDGTSIIGIYDPASLGGYRGAYELPNGNILTTNGGGVHEIDRMGNLVETKIASVSARFITFVGPANPEVPLDPIIDVPTLSGWGLIALVLALAAFGVMASIRRRARG
ncbi:MAG: IPTL-CTERM sorting domain-containing protein [Acidobacteriota bacterium]|nr:IPTL-CTERM sorting domain-containing protein [Acidobacteriota bacterium]